MASSSLRVHPIILCFAGKKKQAFITPKSSLSQRPVDSPLLGVLSQAVSHPYLELSLLGGLATKSEILKAWGMGGAH